MALLAPAPSAHAISHGGTLEPAPEGCVPRSWDAASGTLEVRIQPNQHVTIEPRQADIWESWAPLIEGSMAVGAPVLNLDIDYGDDRPQCKIPTSYSRMDQFEAPLERVKVLRLMTDAMPKYGAVMVIGWDQLTATNPDLRVELVAGASGRVPLVRMHLGSFHAYKGEAIWHDQVDPIAGTTGLRSRALDPATLDLDGDATAELTWIGGRPRLDLFGTQHADEIDLRGFDAVRANVITGAGDDTVFGPPTSTATFAARTDDGNDRVTGGGTGLVSVSGGAGSDVLDVGTGVRLVGSGGDGDDQMIGGSGNDGVDGGAGADLLRTGAGDDSVQGGAGADTIEGGAGRDTVDAGADADIVRGGDGNDKLGGNLGDDRMWGEGGDDLINPHAGRDRAWGGHGNDQVGVAMGAHQAGDGPDDDMLWGGPGNDIVASVGKRDRAWGDAGNDYMQLQGGMPIIDAGPGNDFLYVRFVTGATIQLGTGNDALRMAGISLHAPWIGRRIKVLCGPGRDWLSWQPAVTRNCEAQQQMDLWDTQLGRPIRDDKNIPPMPPRPAAGPGSGSPSR